jgi:uncharacterized protein (TIGR02145 family)
MSTDFCPDGWHVPTEAEINILIAELLGSAFAGGHMKEVGTSHWTTPNTGADDSDGFRAVPGGKFDLLFELLGSKCLLWLQDEGAPMAPVALNGSEITAITFKANWQASVDADGYYLDVATDALFAAPVAGFFNLDVGNVLFKVVTGLTPALPYYYRVRAYNEVGASDNSNIQTVGTLLGVFDADGNVYNVVTIGTQQWLTENLKTTKYIDGSAIPNISNYNDWFLPSKDELNAMYTELYLQGVGGFDGIGVYFSSSEDSSFGGTVVCDQYFVSGFQGLDSKANVYWVRACRSFTSVSPSYSLRDIGPAGGLIFWKSGNDYLEAAPMDQASFPPGQEWSNIYTAIGVTARGTAIGTGQANTTAIIGQAGHINSAAKLCNDLTSDILWAADTAGAYCWYDNDIANKADYGALYNWYAVDHDVTVPGPAKLAPTGWRVPSDADFTTLITYLGGAAVAGGKLKEIGTTHWDAPNVGATDDYGFLCRGTGRRDNSGLYANLKEFGFFWSSTDDAPYPWMGRLGYSESYLRQFNSYIKTFGFSIRCMRDVP